MVANFKKSKPIRRSEIISFLHLFLNRLKSISKKYKFTYSLPDNRGGLPLDYGERFYPPQYCQELGKN